MSPALHWRKSDIQIWTSAILDLTELGLAELKAWLVNASIRQQLDPFPIQGFSRISSV